MDKLLKFLNFMAIDPRLYWQIPTRDRQEQYEVQWQRDERIRWRFRRVGQLLWDLGPESTVLTQLKDLDLDMDIFESKLKHSLLQQVSFADRMVKDARKLFGDEQVDQTLWEHEQFMVGLEDVLKDFAKVSTKPRPQLRVLKAEKVPHL